MENLEVKGVLECDEGQIKAKVRSVNDDDLTYAEREDKMYVRLQQKLGKI